MHQPAVGNLRFGALAKDALQIGNWIARMGERIGPLLLEIRLNHLPHNCDAQIFFALEVMKHCAFGGTRFNYDAIEATALESVFVKFVESGIEDSLSRVFGRPVGGYSHCASINQYRPVGMSSSSNFLFSISQTILDLEEELGVKLLLRTKRTVQLTVAGSAFLHEAEQTLAARSGQM